LRRRVRVGGDTEAEVFCADEQSEVPIDLERWQRLARSVLSEEGIRGGTELSIFFVEADDISDLNQEHMGMSGPTDVLAFPIDAGEVLEVVSGPTGASKGPDRSPPDRGDMPLLLGDIVICPAVARDQAPDHAGNLEDELALLVVHGTLHVLGWDHDTESATENMRRRERQLLETHHWHGPVPVDFRQEQTN
jgi:probable rRNA maturation factor